MTRSEYDVPSYRVSEFAPRKTRYCTVIPVINEGARLTDQLAQMTELNIPSLTDIIIADGGSTDGSTGTQLKACNVRTLLTKTGPGKLSAQLRMAYSYALEQGYEGIVTIDGNGKDSVATISEFVAALDEGVDYAQASRFVPGGSAINTPHVRTLAIKFLHAPILSLAAGRRFSDTTQGFRAYSSRYLLHPEVRPFRKVFQTYELLAYLTVRASQLGLITKEIPSVRTYPASGPIPTKLNMWGNFALIGILLKTLMGRYHP